MRTADSSKKVLLSCAACGKEVLKYRSAIRYQRFFCSHECNMRRPPTKTVEERFWEKVNKTESCWLWRGCLGDKHGHGKISHENKHIYVHRLSWAIHNGIIPEGMEVLHNCPGGDNPACVNPEHLWLGTKSENAKDRHAKGRTTRGSGFGSRVKLKEEDIPLIRSRLEAGESRAVIANDFNVTSGAIYQIEIGNNWKHI